MGTVKVFSNRYPMYTCRVCGKRTRIGNDDERDAQVSNECVTCWEIVEIEGEHEYWKLNGGEHYQEDCPICQGKPSIEVNARIHIADNDPTYR